MENMYNEMCMFEKYAKQVNDLLVDAYKWKLLSEHEDNVDYRQRYEHISHTWNQRLNNKRGLPLF